MGLRGPQPTPTDLLKLAGGYRADRRHDDAPAEPGVPDKPEWLDGRAEAIWDQYVASAGKLPGLLSVNDGNALAAACYATAMFEGLARRLDEQGLMVDDPKKGEVPNPLLRSVREYMEAASRLWAKFGTTPADRVRTNTGTPSAKREGLAKFTRAG